ncbi:hypothetical protein ACNKHM_11260 [Shigella sonnei]
MKAAQLRGGDLSHLQIVGGGCQNTLLNQLCADAGIRAIAGRRSLDARQIGIQLMTLDATRRGIISVRSSALPRI